MASRRTLSKFLEGPDEDDLVRVGERECFSAFSGDTNTRLPKSILQSPAVQQLQNASPTLKDQLNLSSMTLEKVQRNLSNFEESPGEPSQPPIKKVEPTQLAVHLHVERRTRLLPTSALKSSEKAKPRTNSNNA